MTDEEKVSEEMETRLEESEMVRLVQSLPRLPCSSRGLGQWKFFLPIQILGRKAAGQSLTNLSLEGRVVSEAGIVRGIIGESESVASLGHLYL